MADKWCFIDAPELAKIDLASFVVREALDTPYLVGSALERADFRDVDIRVMLADEEYDRLFPSRARHPLADFIEVSITDHYVRASGLRIDFQIQRRSQANERYKGKRIPLGIYPLSASGDEDG
jgi:hypothetical protein